jgi:hypothetical protein
MIRLVKRNDSEDRALLPSSAEYPPVPGPGEETLDLVGALVDLRDLPQGRGRPGDHRGNSK